MIKLTSRFKFGIQSNPYLKTKKTIKIEGKEYKFFSLPELGFSKLGNLDILN